MAQTTEQQFTMTNGKALSLYEQDILLWVEDTVAKLKVQDFENLDLDNLIEEVESLGISQRLQLLNRLTVLLEHLLKRLYVELPQDYNGWERTIRTQRRHLEKSVAPKMMKNTMALVNAEELITSFSTAMLKRLFVIARMIAPRLPTPEASVGVAQPAKIEPSTRAMRKAGGTKPLMTICRVSFSSSAASLPLTAGASEGLIKQARKIKTT